MNWKPTWVLLAAVAIVFVFIVLVEHPLRQERLRQASQAVLRGFDPATITNIEIQPWGQPVIVARRVGGTSGVWQLTHPISYPARNDLIKALLEALAKLEWQDRITEAELRDLPDAQDRYGFIQPQFSLTLQGTDLTRHLEVGRLSALGDQVYLDVEGNSSISLAGADLLSVIPRDKNQWRDLSLLDLTNTPFQKLRVRSAGQELEFERDPTNHLWFMNLPEKARADSAQINELLGQLQQIQIGYFVSDDPKVDLEQYALQNSAQTPDLALSFLQGSNVVAALQVGASLSNHLELAYARRLDPSNIVAVARQPLRAWQGAYTNFLDQHLISVPPGWVESIDVRGDNNFTVQKQANGPWQVLAGANFPADPLLMEFWLAGFTNIPTEIEKTVVADSSVYGLTRPALRYTVKFGPQASGLAPAQIDFGALTNGRVFERRADELFVNTISANDFDRLPRVSWQLRDRAIWSFDSSNVLSVTVHQLGATRQYLRDPNGEWTFAPGYHSPPSINSPSMEEGVHRIGQLRAIYWDGVGNGQLERFAFAQTDHSLEFAVKRADRTETLRLDFGARSPYQHPYASVMRDGQRMIFEFPVDLFENFVVPDFSLPAPPRPP
jgi:hypothetical protein